MASSIEVLQKILLKCGANVGSGLEFGGKGERWVDRLESH